MNLRVKAYHLNMEIPIVVITRPEQIAGAVDLSIAWFYRNKLKATLA